MALGWSILKGYLDELFIAYIVFFSSFSIIIITTLNIESVKVNYYTFIDSLRHGFKLYIKSYIVSFLANSSNTTTILLNTAIDY